MAILAKKGGLPTKTTSFPAWPIRSEHQRKALLEAYESGKWGIGSEKVAEFEAKFAKEHQANYCLANVNGTWAIWVALKACGIKAGDEVIIPPYTFMATATAVIMANAVPVFADIDPLTCNIHPDWIEKVITPRTKAIIPVHIAGNPAHLDKIKTIADKYNLYIIEDAAQAHFAEWNNKRVGSFGHFGTFSFQSSKNVAAGEGGCLITNDEELYRKAFSYNNCGRVIGGKWYQHDILGSNLRLSAFQAALISAQLDEAEAWTKTREENAQYLDALLREIPGITPLQQYPETTRRSHHLYIFRFDSAYFKGISKTTFLESLQAEGIPCSPGYVPLYREKFFQLDPMEYPWTKGRDYASMRLAECEKACEKEVIWLFQYMLLGNKEDMDDIASAIKKIQTHCEELL